jgi:hypothetical protein
MRLFAIVGLLSLAVLTPAQNPLDQGAAFLKGAWSRVKNEGPAAAERAVRTAPAKFKDVEKRVKQLGKDAERWSKDARLEEKKNIALQLWEIRGSLDLMSLVNPDTLEAVLGIDSATLRSLRAQVMKLEAQFLRK